MEPLLRSIAIVLFCSVYYVSADIDPKDLLLYQGVHGKPGVDFPTFSNIPKTTFSCKDVDAGYYADLETDCQVFHICNEGTKISFLCPNGTIFQQSDLICDWWFKVNCTSSPELYEESAEHLREETIKRKASRRVPNNDNRRMSFTTEDIRRKTTIKEQIQNRINSEETQVPQETASFVKDSFFNRNNIRHSSKYPNHRTTYSDLKDPKYFTKDSFHVSSTTSSSIKPEIVVKQKAPINNGKPFTATTVEGIYDNNSGINQSKNKHSTTKSHRQSNKKQTTIYINTNTNTKPAKSTTPALSKATVKYSATTRKYAATTTPSPIIRIAFKNKVKAIDTISRGRKIKESEIVKIVTLPPTVETTTKVIDFTTTQPFESRKSKAIDASENKATKQKPHPFEHVAATTSTTTNDFYYATNNLKTTGTPKYKVSSPRPFYSKSETTTDIPTTLEPTQPTVTSNYLRTVQNVNNMISTLMNLTEFSHREGKDYDQQRPDLVIPPSVGPQTLHTLAVYFANALDNLEPVTDHNPTERYDQSDDISLLSQNTVRKYNNLFRQRHEEIENAMVEMMQHNNKEEDLETQNSKHAFDGPNVRQLAKVFTEALSAYLDDPVGFKKDLEKVRPTDPALNDPYLSEDDEVLNYSDADIQNKDHYLPYSTPSSATTQQETATWGYILALNHSEDDNSIAGENLQQSNSEYYNNRRGKQYTTPSPLEQRTTTTSSLISLFNTQPPPSEKKVSFAPLVRNLLAPTAPADLQRYTQQEVNVANVEITGNNNQFTNGYSETTTTSPIKTTNVLEQSTTNFPKTTSEQFTQTVYKLPGPTTTIFTTAAPFDTTFTDYTQTNTETTQSAVARLFNYFEQRARAPFYTTSSASTAATPLFTNSLSYTTRQFDTETQRNIYEDITKLNNLANIATSSYEPIEYSTTNVPSTDRWGKQLKPETTTTVSTQGNTYIPNNHRQVFSTYTDVGTATATAQTTTHVPPTIFAASTTYRPVASTEKYSRTGRNKHVYYDGHLPAEKDVESRFASLVDKATSILSNIHNVKIQPQKYSESEAVRVDDRGTAATLTENTANLPNNHWTTSSDVAKLWQTTLFVNAGNLNNNLNATEETLYEPSTKSLNEVFDDDSFEASAPTISEVEYDLQALPKLELNSTQVHGVLINFINSTMKTEHKLERFLKKLNTTEDDFLKKMQVIEKNPLTRRLILLLISECNKDLTEGAKRQAKQIKTEGEKHNNNQKQTYQSVKTYRDLVPLPLTTEDQDARALDLLNSLYTIASKYGK